MRRGSAVSIRILASKANKGHLQARVSYAAKGGEALVANLGSNI
jgi:hypothetical protein